MSPKAPSARLLAYLRSSIFQRPFVCSSCLPRRSGADSLLQCRLASSRSHPSKRGFSQIAPVTAVNAQKSIPTQYQELYGAIKGLEEAAPVYVNLSQLQLALRGLESTESIVRVAVLGIDDGHSATQLARALLADPLSEEAEWEKIMRTSHDGKALLIRYGEYFSFESTHPLLQTLTIPATLLERHKLELLVHTAKGASQFEDESPNHSLASSLESRASLSVRILSVVCPVHKAIFLGKGFEGLAQVAGLLTIKERRRLAENLKLVVDVDWAPKKQPKGGFLFINLAESGKAIDELRRSVQYSQEYEHDWLKSHISDLEPFLTNGTSVQDPSALKEPVRNLISVLVSETEAAMTAQEASIAEEQLKPQIAESTRKSLQEAITVWAEIAHTELRDDLESAFASRSWRKLAWWRLLWRVDDVDLIASDILRRTYLVNAEKGLIFVAGRMQEAGLLEKLQGPTPKKKQPLLVTQEEDIPNPKIDVPNPLSPHLDGPYSRIDTDHPWPRELSTSRVGLLRNTIPPLAARAQSSLLQALSTTTLTSALSSLFYFSSSTTTSYEAGVIAALGLTWSARRLQKQWEKAKSEWVLGVELEGKRNLDEVEKNCRLIVQENGRPQPDTAIEEERRKGRAAVVKVKEALARMDERGGNSQGDEQSSGRGVSVNASL